MKPYGLLWGVLGVAAGVYLAQSTSAPQAVGIDPGSLWEQYSPLILGVLLAIANNRDWPAPIRKIIEAFAKSKGGDLHKGEKAFDLYVRIRELLDEVRELSDAEESAETSLQDALHSLNRTIVTSKRSKATDA